MGIRTVAIYSPIDSNSLHVRMADEAYLVGDNHPQTSYLNLEAIIALAQQSNANAIHPGYGFLSENPHFAQACAQSNIVFIGPSYAAMLAMASKQYAKQLLAKTNVPLIPGYHADDQQDATLFAAANKIGFPILLKAANGGGGKGMRIIDDGSDFFNSLNSSRREILNNFGDETLIIEKFIVKARHIEVQIMADNHGQIVHLFERDCSLQRRHQKILEEAPAPNLSETLRHALRTAACTVARTINYSGAGTIEFLLDDDGQFYFMEMNTRLQVEHPVTEMITGIDLVAWQIKIAANQSLPLSQDLIKFDGHAIECRIYAENPEQDFMPSVGTINYLSEPKITGVRVDTGIATNSIISIYYDPLLSKLIAWGENRAEALMRLQMALGQYAISGIKTNLKFLHALTQHEKVQTERITTDFLKLERIIYPTITPQIALLFATAIDYEKLRQITDPLLEQVFAWQSCLSSAWYWHYTIDNQDYAVQIKPLKLNKFTIIINEEEMILSFCRDNEWILLDRGNYIIKAKVNHIDATTTCYFAGDSITIYHNNEPQYTKSELSSAESIVGGVIKSPMFATIIAILKNSGECVAQGERLIVLEAMKMEHTIHAPKDGIVKNIYCAIGDQVAEGEKLLGLT